MLSLVILTSCCHPGVPVASNVTVISVMSLSRALNEYSVSASKATIESFENYEDRAKKLGLTIVKLLNCGKLRSATQ
jgi:hypothetical protein